jgi:hypothetical protein
MLQYADGILLIGEATVDNLWIFKASGLKVNFWKSCLMGENVSDELLAMVSGFLKC